MSTRLERRIVGKAASYTIKPHADAPGTVFTNKGATGAITFTLPAATRALLGHWYEFLGVVAQNITVAPPAVDTLVTLNDTAADSLTLSTGGQIIGGAITVVCVEVSDGVFQWVARGTAVGAAVTAAT